METKYKTRSQLFADVLPELEEIEAKRKENEQAYKQKLVMINIGSSIFIVLSFFLLYLVGILPGEILTFIPVLIIIAVTIYLRDQTKKATNLKQKIGTAILKTVEPEWTFDETRSISNRHIEQSRLFNMRKYESSGKDFFSGDYKGTYFQCSHIDFGKPQDEGGEGIVSSYMFLMADLNKEIEGKTVVLPDKAQQKFGSYLGKKIQEFGWKGLELVYLEDPKFEYYFAVYSEDQIEARYVLTTKMMETLVKIREKFKTNLHVAFVDSKIYIALETPSLMEFNAASPILLEGTFNHFYNRLQLAKYLMDELALSDRIWLKE